MVTLMAVMKETASRLAYSKEILKVMLLELTTEMTMGARSESELESTQADLMAVSTNLLMEISMVA